MEGVGSLCSGFMPPSLSFWAAFTGILSPPGIISRPSGLEFLVSSSLNSTKSGRFSVAAYHLRSKKNTVDPRLSTSTQLVEARDYSIIAEHLLPSQPLVLTMDLDLHDPDNEALSRFPIPLLAQDLSNYYAWQHALYFHLRYHGVFYFITGHEQSRWDLRWQACGVDDNDDGTGNPNPPPTKHDRKNYQRRNMHAYAILFSKIGNIVPALLAAGWDGDKDSFGFRTDLLWNRVQELRHVQREQQERDRAASRLGTANHSMSSRAISLTDDE